MDEFKITAEYLESLEIISMKAGDDVVLFRYDRESNRVFKLREDGSYSGEWGYHPGDQKQTAIPVGSSGAAASNLPAANEAPAVNGGTPAQEQDPEDEYEDEEEEDEEEETSEEEENESGKPKRARKPLSQKDKILILVAGIAVVLCLGLFAMSVVSSMKDQMAQDISSGQSESSEEATDAQESSEPETTEATESVETEPTAAAVTVDVICASEALLPGTVLRSDMFSVATMNEEDYLALDANIEVFTVEEANLLMNLQCASFIPAGQIIRLSDITAEYTALNPWTSVPGDKEMVTLPVSVSGDSLNSVCWGQNVDVEITVETKVQINNATEPPAEGETAPEETTVPGMEHYSSTVESKVLETYKLSSVQIVDALNSDRESLYYRYSVWASIPAPYLMATLQDTYTDRNAISADVPCYITILVPAEQAKALNGIAADHMTVSLSNHTPAFENELQRDAYAEISHVCAAISQIWKELE